MDNETRILILEKSFDYMERFISECFIPNNEEETRKQIEKLYDELLDSSNDEIDKSALKEALRKISALSFEEIEEIYDTLI